MGALHSGHLSLVRRAIHDCRKVVVSIFVNPTQFGPQEDYQSYPRDLQGDLALLKGLPEIKVFVPGIKEVYPANFASSIKVRGVLGERFEAEIRPGHFDGVALVVARLFGLLRPDRAYFGLKDFQQFRVIERVAKDLSLPVGLVGCPTQRSSDGLALSSRNRYLGPLERAKAPALYQALKAARHVLKRGKSPALAEALGRKILGKISGFQIQYFSVADSATLEAPKPGKARVILAAVRLGATRLIDNLKV
jgi:pantoate--beta-alanine ligase